MIFGPTRGMRNFSHHYKEQAINHAWRMLERFEGKEMQEFLPKSNLSSTQNSLKSIAYIYTFHSWKPLYTKKLIESPGKL